MRKTIAVAAVVVLLSGSQAWAASLVFQNAGFDAGKGQFWADIAFWELPAPTTMAGVSLGVTLTGGSGTITPYANATSPHPNRYNGTTGQALVAPTLYAWAYSPTVSSSSANGDLVNFLFVDDALATTTVGNGYVACRLHWQWNGQIPGTQPVLHIQGANPGEEPFYVDADYSFVTLQAGPDLPEPATLSLLLIGAAGTVAARRRAARRGREIRGTAPTAGRS